ncbi:MAG: ABC transporter substrate-binding protein [Candidatus Limnocylindrales bacterium]
MDRRALALGAALTIVIAACTAGASPSPSPSPTVAPTAVPTPSPTPVPQAVKCSGQKVSLELSFIPNVQHAGFLVAVARGYYTDEGLTVEIKPGGPGIEPAQDVADGTANLGLVDYVAIVQARAAGVPIKSVGQVYKLPFFFWYSNKSAGITTVADWKGKKVGAIQVGDYPERDAMLINAGLDPKKDITIVQQDFGTDDFIAGKIDIAEGVVFYHPAFLVGVNHKNWPADFNVYRPADLGADFASQTVAASEDYLSKNPDVIKCFLRASIRGWEATFADAQKAVDDVMTFIPAGAIPKPHQQAAINDVLPIVGSGASDPTLLQIDPAKYAATVAQLVSLGVVTGTPDVPATYDTSFYDTMGPVTAP